MAAEPMPHELTDEELGQIAWDARDWVGTPIPWEHVSPETQANFVRAARAVRAALQPAVPPLAPGETVTIPDAYFVGTENGVQLAADAALLEITVENAGMHHAAWLDAAGVAALERACQRWRAGHNETAGVRIG